MKYKVLMLINFVFVYEIIKFNDLDKKIWKNQVFKTTELGIKITLFYYMYIECFIKDIKVIKK